MLSFVVYFVFGAGLCGVGYFVYLLLTEGLP